jgi:DNA-binding NarL/FixJ family response regulator
VIRVVVVDDHEVARRGARSVLADGYPGAEFANACDAREALACLSQGHWDLAVVDIDMPGPDGLQLLQEVKRRWPRMPVLMLSGFSEEELAVHALKLGAAGYVSKSSASDDLVNAARKVLAGGRYVSAAVAERLAGVVSGDAGQLPHEALTARELQVLRLVASGRTHKEIAADLGLSEKTVATYRQRVTDKLGLSSAVELTRYAVRHRLVA